MLFHHADVLLKGFAVLSKIILTHCEGYVGLVKLLIDKGADVNAKTFVKNSRILRVLNLNTWGLGWPISPDRSSRLRALRQGYIHQVSHY